MRSPRLLAVQADPLEALPDRGNVLDLDPVVLDVVAVGDVRGVPGVRRGDLAERAQLLGAQDLAVAADAEHEELGVELGRVHGGGLAAVEAAALRVGPHQRIRPRRSLGSIEAKPRLE